MTPYMDIAVEAGAGQYAPAARPPDVQADVQLDAPAVPSGLISGEGQGRLVDIHRSEVAQGVAQARDQLEDIQEEVTQHATEALQGLAQEARMRQMDVLSRSLKLAIFKPTGDIYGKILDKAGEIVKTIPPEAVLKTWARMEQYLGKLLDQVA